MRSVIEELDFHKQPGTRNIGIHDSVSEDSEGSNKCGRENQYSLENC